MINLFHKPTPQELWKQHRSDFIKIFYEEQKKPLTHAMMDRAFIDLQARQHYRFNKDITMPGERFGMMQHYMMWMTKALHAEEDEQLDAALETLMIKGLNHKPNISGMGAILQERKKRRKQILHHELLYNFMAVQLVRQDENPEVFDDEIQKSKVIAFKEMTKEGGTYFFFHSQELKKLSNLYELSQDEWEIYWQESLIQQKLLPEALKVYLSSTT